MPSTPTRYRARTQLGAGKGYTKDYCHSGDTDRDWVLSLSEMLRTIQLYNVGQYSCSANTEDGYQPGEGVRDCLPHDLDYTGDAWHLELSEVLRMVQFFNLEEGVYHINPASEDGFAPGGYHQN